MLTKSGAPDLPESLLSHIMQLQPTWMRKALDLWDDALSMHGPDRSRRDRSTYTIYAKVDTCSKLSRRIPTTPAIPKDCQRIRTQWKTLKESHLTCDEYLTTNAFA